jgi:uncharacterized protein YpmS
MDSGNLIAIVVPTAGLVAAVIAALVSWLGHRISQRNAELTAEIARANAVLSARLTSTVKLAEFRQIWINELRADMAEFHSAIIVSRIDHKLLQKWLGLEASILLRINPKDVNHDNLSMAMYNLRSAKDAKDAGRISNEYLGVCQIILKNEWDVLKSELSELRVENG